MDRQANRKHQIDILRGIAIIFVVLFHYTSHYSPEYLMRSDKWTLDIARFGWSGVDIFFVVSGYCIGMTIIKTHNYFEFILKRFARIYPSYVFCGLITLIFYTFFDLPGREVDWITGLMNLVFANFIPGVNFKYIDGIYWALIVELKFYFFFGILYFIFKDLKKSIIAWALFSILLNLILIFDNKTIIILTSISPHANFFLIGLMLFNSNEKDFYSYILIFIIGLTNILLNERYLGYEIYFVLLILLTSLILKTDIKFKINLLSRIGLISFSWYLIHNAVGVIIIREFNDLGFESISVIIAILITLSLSIFSFRFVEKPTKKIIIKKYNLFLKNKNIIN